MPTPVKRPNNPFFSPNRSVKTRISQLERRSRMPNNTAKRANTATNRRAIGLTPNKSHRSVRNIIDLLESRGGRRTRKNFSKKSKKSSK